MGNTSSSVVLPRQKKRRIFAKTRSVLFSRIVPCGASTSSSTYANEHLHEGTPLVNEKHSEKRVSNDQPHENQMLAYSPSYATFSDSSEPASLAYDNFLKAYPGIASC